MRTIARFQVPEEAHLFRLFLGSRGIPAYVWDEYVVQMFWHYSGAIGGVRVVVEASDFDKAVLEYREYVGEVSIEASPTTVVRAWPLTLLFSWFVGAPVLIFGRRKVEDKQDGSKST